jgi:hypothetical protein
VFDCSKEWRAAVKPNSSEATIRQVGDLESLGRQRRVAPASRRRQGPVALRPRLSPGVPCRGMTELVVGTETVKRRIRAAASQTAPTYLRLGCMPDS